MPEKHSGYRIDDFSYPNMDKDIPEHRDLKIMQGDRGESRDPTALGRAQYWNYCYVSTKLTREASGLTGSLSGRSIYIA